MTRELTNKQKAFVDYYIETLNATQAYKLAGYSAKNDNVAGVSAFKLLKDSKINDAIEKRLAELANKRISSAEEVLEFLSETMRDTDAKLDARLKASELLGRRYKMFTDKIEVDATVDVEVNLSGFDEQE